MPLSPLIATSPAMPFVEDPAGFDDADDDLQLVPVEVPATRKRRKQPKGKGPKKAKAKGSAPDAEPSAPSSPHESRAQALVSFPESYQAIIKTLPVCLWPVSSKHGQHSYTM